MCLAAWVPIRKHAVGVGRGWEPISFFTAQLPRRASSLVPCPSLISSPIPPALLHLHSPPVLCSTRIFPGRTVAQIGLCAQSRQSFATQNCSSTNSSKEKKKGEILKVSGLSAVPHKAAVQMMKRWKRGCGERGVECDVGWEGVRAYILLMLMWGLLLEHCVKT